MGHPNKDVLFFSYQKFQFQHFGNRWRLLLFVDKHRLKEVSILYCLCNLQSCYSNYLLSTSSTISSRCSTNLSFGRGLDLDFALFQPAAKVLYTYYINSFYFREMFMFWTTTSLIISLLFVFYCLHLTRKG